MSAVEAKDEEVREALDQYATRLEAMDDEGAAQASNRLVEMDCGVCTGIGQHLTALAVAVQTAPDPGRKEAVRREALQSAESVAETILG